VEGAEGPVWPAVGGADPVRFVVPRSRQRSDRLVLASPEAGIGKLSQRGKSREPVFF